MMLVTGSLKRGLQLSPHRYRVVSRSIAKVSMSYFLSVDGCQIVVEGEGRCARAILSNHFSYIV